MQLLIKKIAILLSSSLYFQPRCPKHSSPIQAGNIPNSFHFEIEISENFAYSTVCLATFGRIIVRKIERKSLFYLKRAFSEYFFFGFPYAYLIGPFCGIFFWIGFYNEDKISLKTRLYSFVNNFTQFNKLLVYTVSMYKLSQLSEVGTLQIPEEFDYDKFSIA